MGKSDSKKKGHRLNPFEQLVATRRAARAKGRKDTQEGDENRQAAAVRRQAQLLAAAQAAAA